MRTMVRRNRLGILIAAALAMLLILLGMASAESVTVADIREAYLTCA